MKPTVHILATVRNPELLDAAMLVFRTLRTGFPTASVRVWGNALQGAHIDIVAHAAERISGGVFGSFQNLPPTSHDLWIEGLIQRETHPFWICDTDICLWAPVEDWFEQSAVTTAGRLEPEFEEEWTQSLHKERLHTCLMYINPAPLRAAMSEFMSRIPGPWGHSAEFPFVRQNFVPRRNVVEANGKSCCDFYDTCSGLWQAGIGTPFTEEQNSAFDHLHCATYADLITLNGVNLKESHQAVYRNHEAARGIRRQQDAYYTSRSSRRANAGALPAGKEYCAL